MKGFQNFNFTASNLKKAFKIKFSTPQITSNPFCTVKCLQIILQNNYFNLHKPPGSLRFLYVRENIFEKMEHTLWQLQFLSLMFRGFMRCVIFCKEYWGHYSALWKPVWPSSLCHRCRVRMSGKKAFSFRDNQQLTFYDRLTIFMLLLS